MRISNKIDLAADVSYITSLYYTYGGLYIARGILMRNRKGITETNERGWQSK